VRESSGKEDYKQSDALERLWHEFAEYQMFAAPANLGKLRWAGLHQRLDRIQTEIRIDPKESRYKSQSVVAL